MKYQELCALQAQKYNDLANQIQDILDLSKQASIAGEGTYHYQSCNADQSKLAKQAQRLLRTTSSVYKEWLQNIEIWNGQG